MITVLTWLGEGLLPGHKLSLIFSVGRKGWGALCCLLYKALVKSHSWGFHRPDWSTSRRHCLLIPSPLGVRISTYTFWRVHKTWNHSSCLNLSVSHSVVPNSLRPHRLQPTSLLSPWDFPGKDTGVGCRFLLQGIFPTQGSNLRLLHCRQILYWLSYKGKPGLTL